MVRPGLWWREKSKRDRYRDHLAWRRLSVWAVRKYSRFLWSVQISKGWCTVRVRILLITEPCVFHIHSHPPPCRTTLILILHDIQTSDPPCSCSVLIVNVDSPRISVHF